MSRIERVEPKNQGESKMTGAVASVVFSIIGLTLGVATLIINPYGAALTAFVSAALFIMTLASIANYAVYANRRKMFHRIVVAVEAVAAVVVILEVLLHATSETLTKDLQSLLISRAFDFVVILAFLFFELYLGYDVWRYLHTKS
jgi:hypothetical protein